MKMVTHLTCMTSRRELLFKTYLFCQRKLEDILIKLKDKSPQEHWVFVFLERRGIQASPRGISSFQLRCHSWGAGYIEKKRGAISLTSSLGTLATLSQLFKALNPQTTGPVLRNLPVIC